VLIVKLVRVFGQFALLMIDTCITVQNSGYNRGLDINTIRTEKKPMSMDFLERLRNNEKRKGSS